MLMPSSVVEPEVLSNQHDVICSTSIERIVSGRNAALRQIEAVINQIAEISRLTQSIDGGQPTDWSCESGRRYDCRLLQPAVKAMPGITRNIDRHTFIFIAIWPERTEAINIFPIGVQKNTFYRHIVGMVVIDFSFSALFAQRNEKINPFNTNN